MEELQSWWEVPTIAHFCSLFRAAFNLLDFDIEELEEALLCDGTEEGSPFLQDLIIRLLAGCYEDHEISPANYTKYLHDFVQRHWVKQLGKENILNGKEFRSLSLRDKVEILHALCDARLDAPDVAEVLKNLEADSLRVEPLGKDDGDATFWYFYGTRLYKEDPKAAEEAKAKLKERVRRKKEREKKRKKKEKKKRRERKEKVKGKRERKSSSSESDSDDEPLSKIASKPSLATGWYVVCSTEEEWQQLAECFRKSKSRCERDLFRTLTVDFIPEIGRMILEKEKQEKRKLTEIIPRRSSQRIEKIRQQKEEEDRLATIAMIEEQKQLLQELEERRYQVETERKQREVRQREERYQERQVAREERARRVQLREERAHLLAEGKELPPHLRLPSFTAKRRSKGSEMFTESDEDLSTGLYKVYEMLQNHPDSWPFMLPVDEVYAPGYYSIVKKPMDLSVIEKKLQDHEYDDRLQFEDDVMLIFDNCRKYNGVDSEYTRMAENLRRIFFKSVERFFPSENSDEDEEFTIDELTNNISSKKQANNRPKRQASMKAIEMLAQAAEQALRDASQRNADTPTLSDSSAKLSTQCSSPDSDMKIGGAPIIIASTSQTSTSIPVVIKNVKIESKEEIAPKEMKTVTFLKIQNNENKGTKEEKRRPIYCQNRSAENVSPISKNADKEAQMSKSLDAISKMVDGLPEGQRKSILNFTARYRASLKARSEKNCDDSSSSSTAENGRSNHRCPTAAFGSLQTMIIADASSPNNQNIFSTLDTEVSSSSNLSISEGKENTKLLFQETSTAKSEAPDIIANRYDQLTTINQATLKNLRETPSQSSPNPVGLNSQCPSSVTQSGKLKQVGPSITDNGKSVTSKLNSSATMFRGSIPLTAVISPATSNQPTTVTVLTASTGSLQTSSSAEKTSTLPNNAIPMKKRAYHGVETSFASCSSSGPNILQADSSEEPKIQKTGISTNPLQVVSSNSVESNTVQNGRNITSVVNKTFPLSNHAGNASNSIDHHQVELLNSMRKSVISSSCQKSNEVTSVAEGLAGKLQQQTERIVSDKNLAVNGSTENGSGLLPKNYVQLPRGYSPMAENFARTMNMPSIPQPNKSQLNSHIVQSRIAETVRPEYLSPSSAQQGRPILPRVHVSLPGVNSSSTSTFIQAQGIGGTILQQQQRITSSDHLQLQKQERQQQRAQLQNSAHIVGHSGHARTIVPVSVTNYSHSYSPQQPLIHHGIASPSIIATPATPNNVAHITTVVNQNPNQLAAATAQLQYVDQSGIRYAAVPANMMSIGVQQPQQQQLFYVHQQNLQGQVLLQQQHVVARQYPHHP